MTGSNEIIRYANHVAAITENLRGESGAVLICRRALKSVTEMLTLAHKLSESDKSVKKRTLDLVLSEYHKLGYCMDSLYAKGFIEPDAYSRITNEGNSFRSSVLLSIAETRTK